MNKHISKEVTVLFGLPLLNYLSGKSLFQNTLLNKGLACQPFKQHVLFASLLTTILSDKDHPIYYKIDSYLKGKT